MAMTFRPSKGAAKALEQIKQEADIVTNSKAIEHVLHKFPVIQKELKDLYAALYEAQLELRNIKMTVANKTESDMAYNKMISGLISK